MSDFFCAAPWRGLHINPRGDVKTCCAGDPNMLGNLNTHSIEQILHGPKMIEIRQTLREGRAHAYCYNCVQAEQYGSSERDWHNRMNSNLDYSSIADNDYHPTIIDVRWNTTCNLSCNYCGPFCSSQWASLMKIEYKSGARPYYEQVCEFIDQHRDHVQEVALVGGEPLLLPENERLLDVIPDSCKVTLITNMNVDFEKNRIVKKLSQRTNVGWSMSFDNVGDRVEYVRSGSDWAVLDKNVRTVAGWIKNQGHYGGIHSVYNIYNCTRLDELKNYAKEVGLDILWQMLYQPDYLDPAMHSPALRTLAKDHIEQYQKTHQLNFQERTFFDNVCNRFDTMETDWQLNVARFREHIHLIETKYHQHDKDKFGQLWPEIKELVWP
jgi:MoaA/NifB/PqqE/SkfB family radical SAM enzyme